jgi:hypothetical protein
LFLTQICVCHDFRQPLFYKEIGYSGHYLNESDKAFRELNEELYRRASLGGGSARDILDQYTPAIKAIIDWDKCNSIPNLYNFWPNYHGMLASKKFKDFVESKYPGFAEFSQVQSDDGDIFIMYATKTIDPIDHMYYRVSWKYFRYTTEKDKNIVTYDYPKTKPWAKLPGEFMPDFRIGREYTPMVFHLKAIESTPFFFTPYQFHLDHLIVREDVLHEMQSLGLIDPVVFSAHQVWDSENPYALQDDPAIFATWFTREQWLERLPMMQADIEDGQVEEASYNPEQVDLELLKSLPHIHGGPYVERAGHRREWILEMTGSDLQNAEAWGRSILPEVEKALNSLERYRQTPEYEERVELIAYLLGQEIIQNSQWGWHWTRHNYQSLLCSREKSVFVNPKTMMASILAAPGRTRSAKPFLAQLEEARTKSTPGMFQEFIFQNR